MNFSPKTCCRLCAKGHKKDDINVLKDSELGKSIKTICGIEMKSHDLSTFICCDCRVSTIAFSANYDRVQYVQGQIKKYASMSTASMSTASMSTASMSTASTSTASMSASNHDQRPVPQLQAMKPKRSAKAMTENPYFKTESMAMKLGDPVKFVSSGEMVHGIIDGLFSKQGRYQIKTNEGEIFKIFHLSVLRDDSTSK